MNQTGSVVMKSSNLAIVFVDIAGFSERTSQQSRDQSEAWLCRYEELLLPLVKAFGGRKIKSIGDAYLITFISPTNALLFAMAAQDRLYEYNRSAPACERIEIRVACNVGEVRQLRGDVYGEPVNIAARLENITPPGEIWFTEAVFLAMTKSEVPSEEVGDRTLKGIQGAVRIFQIPKGSAYRLSSLGEPNVQNTSNDTKIPLYPYGGMGLKHAERIGWAILVTFAKTRMTVVGRHGRQLANRLKTIPSGISNKMFFGVAGGILLILLLVAVWPPDTYHEVRDAIQAGNPKRALALLNGHTEGDEPAGQALRARALLMQDKADVNQAADLLHEAISKNASLARHKPVVMDLVECLNRSNADETMTLLQEKIGDFSVPYLVTATRSDRYWLRWNSIHLLEKMGESDEVDMAFAYIQDLRFAGSCSTRKQAAKKLAQIKDQRALTHLRKAKEKNFFENLCMGDTLDDAIRTIEIK